MSSTADWQHPYVDIFRLANIEASDRKATIEGDVERALDKEIGRYAYKLNGSVPASNFIQIPASKSQSLALTGRYAYCQFRPVPAKNFALHFDLQTNEGISVRISISNLYKKAKATASVVQIPWLFEQDRWCTLAFDWPGILSVHTTRTFQSLKGIQICACSSLRNVYTSATKYTPETMPKPTALPTGNHSYFDVYDWYWCESEITPMAGTAQNTSVSATVGIETVAPRTRHVSPVRPVDTSRSHTARGDAEAVSAVKSPGRSSMPSHTPGTVSSKSKASPASREAASPRDAIENIAPVETTQVSTASTPMPRSGVSAPLPNPTPQQIWSTPHRPVRSHTPSSHSNVSDTSSAQAAVVASSANAAQPVLSLQHIGGFSGAHPNMLLWLPDSRHVAFGAGAIVVIANIVTGEQRQLVGAAAPLCVLVSSVDGYLIAAAEQGGVIRVWDQRTGQLLLILSGHFASVTGLSFSSDGRMLAACGANNQGRGVIVVRNISRIGGGEPTQGNRAPVLAVHVTDYDVRRVKFSPYEPYRLFSCGRGNIRFWRLKGNELRATAVSLEHHTAHLFTDLDFEAGLGATDTAGRRVFVSSDSGMVFQLSYESRELESIYRLHDKAINALAVTDGFCVTASDDMFLRVWPLDFTDFHLAARHEASVTGISISADHLKILAGASNGSLGVMDLSTRTYQTKTRSHTGAVRAIAVATHRREFATTAADRSIKVWDLDTHELLYQFDTPNDDALCMAYHPRDHILACGFQNGLVRVLAIPTTSVKAEPRQHERSVTSLAYSPDGTRLFSIGSDGRLVVYDVGSDYQPSKMLADACLFTVETTAGLKYTGSEAACLSLSPSGELLAFTGPNLLTVTVVSATTLRTVATIEVGAPVVRFELSALSPAYAAAAVTRSPSKSSSAAVCQLVAATAAGAVLTYSVPEGKLLGTVTLPSAPTSLAVTHTGDHILAGCDHMVYAVPARATAKAQRFTTHCGKVLACKLTPDSQQLITGGEDAVVATWRLDTSAALDTTALNTTAKSVQQPAPAKKQEAAVPAKAATRTAPVPTTTFPPATSGEAGMALDNVLGYSGGSGGFGDMCWHEAKGELLYASNTTVVADSLELDRQLPLLGHWSPVGVLAISPDGLILASGSASGSDDADIATIRIWRRRLVGYTPTEWEPLFVMGLHQHGVQALAFSPDGRYLASLGKAPETNLVIWDVATGHIVRASSTQVSMYAVQWNPNMADELVTVGDHAVYFWFLDDSKQLRYQAAKLPTEEDPSLFLCVAFGLDDGGDEPALMYVGGEDGRVYAFDTHSNSCVASWNAASGLSAITVIACRGRFVTTGGSEAVLRLWDVGWSQDEGVVVRAVDEIALEGQPVSLALSEDGARGVVGTDLHALWFISWTYLSADRLVCGHVAPITALAAPRAVGSLLGTAGADGIRLWTRADRSSEQAEQLLCFQVKDERCLSLDMDEAADDFVLAAGFDSGVVRQFSVVRMVDPAKSSLLSLQLGLGPVTAVLVLYKGRYVVTGHANGVIAVIDAQQNKVIRTERDHLGSAIVSLKPSPRADELWMAVDARGRISVWLWNDSLHTVQLLLWKAAALPDNVSTAGDLAVFLPDVDNCIAFADEKHIVVLDFMTQQEESRIPVNQPLVCLAVSPTGSVFAAGTVDRVVKLVDRAGAFQDFVAHSGSIAKLRFATNAQRTSTLYSVANDELFLWNVFV